MARKKDVREAANGVTITLLVILAFVNIRCILYTKSWLVVLTSVIQMFIFYYFHSKEKMLFSQNINPDWKYFNVFNISMILLFIFVSAILLIFDNVIGKIPSVILSQFVTLLFLIY